jgi:hypothetical protein
MKLDLTWVPHDEDIKPMHMYMSGVWSGDERL